MKPVLFRLLAVALAAIILLGTFSAMVLASGSGKVIQSITIFGARHTPAETILRHLGVREGDTYSEMKLRLGVTWLRHNDLFASVDYEVIETGNAVDINLMVNENFGSSTSGGKSVFGAVDREERYGFFDFGLPVPTRMLGANFDMTLGLNISDRSFMIAPEIEGIELFGAPLGWRVKTKYITKTIDDRSGQPERVAGVEIGVRQALFPSVTGMANLGYEYEYKMTDMTSDHYFFLTNRLQFDAGPMLLFAEAEGGYSFGDTDNGFYFKAAGKAELPVRLSEKWFLLGEAQAGWASANTPYRALYDVGNASGMRGYNLEEADLFTIGSVGLYWNFFDGVQAYAFCDLGSVRYPADVWSPFMLDGGIGLRWNLMGLYASYNIEGQFDWGIAFETYF